MNKINQSNEHSRLASPFVSEEVKNVIKNTTKQANAINNISNYVTTQQQKENQSKFDIPLLRAPHADEYVHEEPLIRLLPHLLSCTEKPFE